MSPTMVSSMPAVANAPKLCPAVPLNSKRTRPSGSLPYSLLINAETRVATARSVLRIGRLTSASPCSTSERTMSWKRRLWSSVAGFRSRQGSGWSPGISSLRSTPSVLGDCLTCAKCPAMPTILSTVWNPSSAIISRRFCARKRMRLITYSGLPLKRERSAGFCVATPTGQVSRLQTRIITQPMETSGSVAKPNSSAPSSAAMAMSRPVMSLPSVSTRTLPRKPFAISV